MFLPKSPSDLRTFLDERRFSYIPMKENLILDIYCVAEES
ncbi:unnamed protein product [Brassica oleracea var. botrytis]|uniref:(rape) hypothetical protein n=1 Tax=Brassica napus TaxID=3708 RepID=A0A816IFG7_BRANA|nr:unnamed protein product [Brassica napus]